MGKRPGENGGLMKLFLTIIVVALPAGVFRAPGFLAFERPLEEVDCVIAMLGGDFAIRKQEALSLIEKGVADTMLIPAWRQVIRYDGGSRKPMEKKTVANFSFVKEQVHSRCPAMRFASFSTVKG